MKRWLVVSILTLAALTGCAWGRVMTPEVEDSLHVIHPRQRAHWLKERSIDQPGFTSPFYPDSLNMTCVGRWSYGPSYDITGRIADHDTVLFLARGSGVSVLQFHGGARPTISLLADINCMGLAKGVEVQDSWLYVAASGIEIYNIARPSSPIKLGVVNSPVNALAVQDTFLCAVSGDSFMVFDVRDRSRPLLIGACRDSGDCVAVAGNTAFLGQRWGLYLIDISNPRSPHRVGSWGTNVISVAARRKLCYACTYNDNSFHILNVANPSSPQELSNLGVRGWKIDLNGDQAYLSCFALLDIADSSGPGIISQLPLAHFGVWATGLTGRAFTAGLTEGLTLIDLQDPVNPALDSSGILAYADSRDIDVDGGSALVDNNFCGIKLLNIANPTLPCEVASHDTAGEMPSSSAARLRGSLGYAGWTVSGGWRGLRIVSFADSATPVVLGSVLTFNQLEAMALRDSFLYCAQQTKFQVLSVMDSTRPVVVSTCSLGFMTLVHDVCLGDSTAYVANTTSGLRIINVADPRNPVPIAVYMPPRWAYSVAVQDRIAYVGTSEDLRIVNVANPQVPVELGVFSTQGYVQGVQVKDGHAVVGNILRMLDVSDPANPRQMGFYVPPMQTFKIFWTDSLIYAACNDAGVIIVKYTGSNACVERPSEEARFGPTLAVVPNPTTGLCRVRLTPSQAKLHALRLYDSAGRLIRLISKGGSSGECIALRGIVSGVYFLKADSDNQKVTTRIVLVKSGPG
jgi:hypothetical protein